MRFREISEEVLYTCDPVTKISSSDVSILKARAAANPRRRIRLCAHESTDDDIHEMVIVHPGNAYVRPHKHLGKSESFHVIEGRLRVVIFDENGSLVDLVRMGDYVSGLTFYYRLSRSLYHSVVADTEWVIFHETTKGPLREGDTLFAPWGPSEDDRQAQSRYLTSLYKRMQEFGPKG